MGFTVICCLLVCGLVVAHALPNGAPTRACKTLLPSHQGVSPSSDPVPYTIELSQTTYTPGSPITVTIKTQNRQKYPIAGFLLQGRQSVGTSTTSVGTFSGPPAGTKLMKCDQNNDAFTHASPADKGESLTVTWNPPTNDAGAIVISGTIAASKGTYFGVLSSGRMTYAQDGKPTGTASGPHVIVAFVISSVMAISLL